LRRAFTTPRLLPDRSRTLSHKAILARISFEEAIPASVMPGNAL
jgi:hypothetical protein